MDVQRHRAYQEAINMNIGRQMWNQLGITGKFSFAFSLMLIFMILIAATSLFSLHYISQAEEKINKSTTIEQLVLEMDRGLEKARRLHGSFFLQYQHIGLQSAHEAYAQPSVREIAGVIMLSSKLKKLLFQSDTADFAGINPADINLYLSSAERFAKTSIEAVELVSLRAAPKRGLEAQLGAISMQLEKELPPLPDLVSKLTLVGSSYKDYLISRQRFLMQLTLNVLGEVRSSIELATSLSSEKKSSLVDLCESYQRTAVRLLDTDLAISGKLRDFNLQEQTVFPLSKRLLQLTREEVELAEKQIDNVHAMAGFIVLATTSFVLFVALYIAFLMHNSVTKKVLNLTSAAEEFSKGNLDVQIRINSEDELGRLGTIFNTMAGRLKDMVENLEKKVEQRTAAQKRAQEEGRKSESFYRQLFAHSSSGVAVYEATDDGGDFIFKDVNHAAETINQVSREELIGHRVTKSFPGFKKSSLFEVFHRVWLTGEPEYHTFSFRKADQTKCWHENRMYKLPSGEIVAVFDDITAKKLATGEKQAMELRLRRAEKMEAIGLLAGGVAHDLNNILSAVVGYPEILLLDLPEDSALRKPLEATKEAGERATAVVADLLTVARGIASTKEAKDLNALVREYLASPEFRKLQKNHPNVLFNQNLIATLPAILCSPVHIKKSIMNLVTNGAEAIENAGTVTLATTTRTPEKEWAYKHGLKHTEYVVLSISDSGIGIQEKDLEHIFEPFYTKKVMGTLSGTGLGLSIVWSTMQDHQGTVIVMRKDKTTIFDLYFPATSQAITSSGKQARDMALQGNGETILVVDDEPQQRDLTRSMLIILGYQVVCEDSGEKAIGYLREHQIDLVLIDMLMGPGINGRQTYEQIVTIKPDQKAIIISGFSESDDVKIALNLGAGKFIQKPFSMDQLGRALKEVLYKRRV